MVSCFEESNVEVKECSDIPCGSKVALEWQDPAPAEFIHLLVTATD